MQPHKSISHMLSGNSVLLYTNLHRLKLNVKSLKKLYNGRRNDTKETKEVKYKWIISHILIDNISYNQSLKYKVTKE